MGAKEKKPKKPKLTKAEKEKVKKEEAEQKAKEEEEARLLAEQAELERLEQERIEAEERRLLEERERVRHQAEIDGLNKKLEKNKEYLAELRKVAQQKNKWDRYMLCDGRPDPTCKKEINSYINLTREDTNNLNLGKVLKTCELVLELIAELDLHIEEVREELREIPRWDEESQTDIVITLDEVSNDENKKVDENNNEKNTIKKLKSSIESFKESKLDLQELINYKLDEASFALLKSPGQSIDPDDLNIQCCEQTENLKICVWGNSSKNPRVKQVIFHKDAFTMELPKPMALLDIAVRVLYMNFDPFSFKSSLFNMKVPAKEAMDLPVIGIEVDQGSEEQTVDHTLRKDLKSSLSIAPSTKNALSIKDMASKSRLGTAMSNTNSTRGGSKIAVDQASAAPSKVEVTESVLPVDPGAIENDDLIDEDVVDLRLFSPMGCLMYIDLLQLPPQPKEVKGWLMQQVMKGGLTRIPYGPIADSVSQETTNANSNMSVKLKDSMLSIGYDQPLAFAVRVDEKVMFHEDPQIARWDEPTQNWKLDGITDAQYDGETGMLVFRSMFFGPYAVIQDKYLSLPFQSWQLCSTGLNKCVLNLISATVEVNILIKDGECCVQFPEEVKKVGHIAGKWMKPSQLIDALRLAGINLFPYEDGHKYVKIYPKEEGLITPFYQYMALLASAYSFMLSKWNIECGEEKVVIQAVEWIGSKAPPQVPYNLYYGTTRICYQLNMQEEAKEFSKDVVPNSPMHPDVYHMLRNGASEPAKLRLKDTSVVFIDCVHQLLKASNILVYS